MLFTEEFRMIRKAVLGIGMLGVIVAPLLAQRANLRGTWKLNASKSNLGPFPGPETETRVLDQSGSTFTESVSSEGGQTGAQNYAIVVQTDGREVSVPADSPMANLGMLKLQKISAAWQGNALVVNEAMRYQESADVDAKNRYTVSPDGKVLTIDQH